MRFHDETFCPRCFGATCGCVWRKKNDPSFVFEKIPRKFPLVKTFPDLVSLQPLTGPEFPFSGRFSSAKELVYIVTVGSNESENSPRGK